MHQAKEKGFGTTHEEIDIHEKFALIHSEVSEAYEAYRKNGHQVTDDFIEELGDVMQRIMHLAGCFNINLEQSIIQKIKKNKSRDWSWDKMNIKR